MDTSQLISCEEMARMIARRVNIRLRVPIADPVAAGETSFTLAAPATGQLFTVTVTDALARQGN